MPRPRTKYTEYSSAYYTQKSSAIKRNIDWKISIEEWVNWWGDDYQCRGRKTNDLVMARYGDVGPYKIGNIYKSTAQDNASLANKDKSYLARSGKYNGKARAIITPDGEFDTLTAASKYYNISAAAICYRLTNKNMPEYRYKNIKEQECQNQ